MEVNLTTVIFTIINVLILYWYLRKFLFTPVTNFMNKRTKSIEDKIQSAEEKLKTAEEAKVKYESKLQMADDEGKKIIDEYRTKAIKRSDDIIMSAKKEAEAIRKRAELDAEREYERVQDEIKKQIVELSLLAAKKSIGEQLDEEKHHELIREFISKVGV
ncbi:F0F1 ATP synthase subunit B [Fonticella tunisiensis]|uniref:ATP synthase subunit b n=1 Tax=Fonticella tunisiensis TaxID=1096341 RepID=A0A4R7KSA5_9CLOT|nr:F0F1 ATP synthase subunit B [Fonticella tunisiensis]TDT62390.1 ATP synthase F0 subcomplex B subunit [Fonticella tunisiensis]